MSERIHPASRPDDSQQFIRGFHGEPIEVTSLNRPDTAWRFIDANGHEHRWFDGDTPATSDSPMRKYTLPTLVRIVDAEGTDEYPEVAHYECRACRKSESEQR